MVLCTAQMGQNYVGYRLAVQVASGRRPFSHSIAVRRNPEPGRVALDVSCAQAASMIAVTPMPPAVQTEIRPRPLPFSERSFAITATILAPVAAKG